VQTVAKKNADDFFAAFSRHLGGTGVKAEVVPPAAPAPGALVPGVATTAAAPAGRFSSLGAPVPAWMVVFCTGLGFALGYCVALLR
jgi:hypothetical protein